MPKQYVQYGCGLSAPKEWVNFDASPTLVAQRIPVLGNIFYSLSKTKFPRNIKFGDIVKGLPLKENSCNGVYCSHILEHLSYTAFYKALQNTYRLLKPGGLFRLVMPDLEMLAKNYIQLLSTNESGASVKFMRDSGMATEARNSGLKAIIENSFGNSKHLWLWDKYSAKAALMKAGFVNIRECRFNDSTDEMFKLVESKERFDGALALEAIK
jgi:predicted SAM-dependent methyltransferase